MGLEGIPFLWLLSKLLGLTQDLMNKNKSFTRLENHVQH